MNGMLVSILGGAAGGVAYVLWRAWRWDREMDRIVQGWHQQPGFEDAARYVSAVWAEGNPPRLTASEPQP